MNLVLQIKHSDLLIESDWTKPKNWALSLLTGNLSNYKQSKTLMRVDYWWIEFDSNGFNVNRKIGFDIFKSPLTGLNNIKLVIDRKNINFDSQIDSDLFNDVFNIYDKRDFENLSQIQSRYLEDWRQSDKIDSPKFPCILIDMESTTEIIKVDTIEQFINQTDFTGYEWTNSERLIDSNGNIYQTEYFNLGHPVGVVIPKGIERKMDNSELTKILSNNDIEFNIKD